MTGHSQEELVGMLRSTRQGESVCVVVARQEEIFLPRELVRDEQTNTNYGSMLNLHTVSRLSYPLLCRI